MKSDGYGFFNRKKAFVLAAPLVTVKVFVPAASTMPEVTGNHATGGVRDAVFSNEKNVAALGQETLVVLALPPPPPATLLETMSDGLATLLETMPMPVENSEVLPPASVAVAVMR